MLYYFLFVIKFGYLVIVLIEGNLDCYIILWGGDKGINYDVELVVIVCVEIEKLGYCLYVMVDFSYVNSSK